MQYKYLYIDDEGKYTSEALADGLSSENVSVEYKHVSEFTTEYIKNNLVNYDGILLDLRLDDTPNSSDFTATEFAQHIRTLVTKGELTKDLPIILFSTDEKLQQVYATDLSSHNLFDSYIRKVNTHKNASKELSALAKGYIKIEKNQDNITKLMGVDKLSNLQNEILSRFLEEKSKIPIHEYAQFILKELIFITGVLINEDILASRLGVDKLNTNIEDWNKIKELFENAKYKGVFCEAWDRWWINDIDSIFNKITGHYLAQLNAKEKINKFNEMLQSENIKYSEPIKHNHSFFYSTVCKAYNRPLDVMEGFRVYSTKEPKSWQEYEYFSLDAFLEGKLEEKNIKIHSIDKEELFNAIEDMEL